MTDKQKLNQAFSEIDDALIVAAQNVPMRRRLLRMHWATVAAAVILIIGVSIGVFARLATLADTPQQEGEVSIHGWTTLQSDSLSVTKQKIGSSGLTYLLNIHYDMYQGEQALQPAEDVRAEMFGQWIISQCTFDYSQHFPLFAEEFFRKQVYPDIEKLNITKEQAYQKMASVAWDVVGFQNCRAEYRILDIESSPELLQEFKEKYAPSFEGVGLDVNKIEEVCRYLLSDVTVVYNDMFYTEIDFDPNNYLIYKYDGIWYMAPHLMEDDLSIDLLQSNQNEQSGYYRLREIAGNVTGLENGYLVIDETHYFLMNDDHGDISVGDTVIITYYSVGAQAKRLADDARCKIEKTVTVQKVDPVTGIPNEE